MNAVLAVFIGGGLGSLARFGIGKMTGFFFSSSFPLATLISNLLSCAILAFGIGFFSEKLLDNYLLRLFILTGFCGGFSTFSTFSHETLDLFRTGNYFFGALNILLNLTVCLIVIALFTKNN